MEATISVRVSPEWGLSADEEIRKELAQITGLEWEARSPDGPPPMGAFEIILETVAKVSTEMLLKGIIEKIEAMIKRHKDERLQPPPLDVAVIVEDSPERDGGPAAEPKAEPGSDD